MGKGRHAETLDREALYDVTPHGNASYLLMQYGRQLLVVRNEQLSHSDLYVLDDTGIWRRGDEVLHGWLLERGDSLRRQALQEAQDQNRDEKSLIGALRSIRPLFDPRELLPLRKIAAASYAVLRKKYQSISGGDNDFGVTRCFDPALDADLQFFGCESGVIDLHTGKLLAPEEGRKHLITKRAPVRYALGASHPDVDRLFAHLPPDQRDWWWRALGFALRGVPSRRFYELKGPPGGGKNGLMRALTGTLGPYASITQASLLEMRRGGSNESETGLSPQVVHIVPPVRLAFVNEVKPTRLNHRILKDYSGDGLVSWQPKNKDPRTDPVSATLILLCNPGSQAQLGGHDEGIRVRLRALPYPAIPKDAVIDDFNDVRIKDPTFKEALFARLVAAAAHQPVGKPPEEPISIKKATTQRIVEDVGEIGVFAARVVRGSGVLTSPDVWAAWCEHNDEPTDATEAGGISRNRLGARLREHVTGFPERASPLKQGGKNVRGWRGWRLLTVEEAENETAARQIVADLLAAVRKWDPDQIDKWIALLRRFAEGEIMEFDGRFYISAPAYSYMENEEEPPAAFEQAYKRLLPMRVRTDSHSIDLETEIAIVLAENYLVQAAYRLPNDATAEVLASEAVRLMKVGMSTTSVEFRSAAKLLTSELEKIIQRVCNVSDNAMPDTKAGDLFNGQPAPAERLEP